MGPKNIEAQLLKIIYISLSVCADICAFSKDKILIEAEIQRSLRKIYLDECLKLKRVT